MQIYLFKFFPLNFNFLLLIKHWVHLMDTNVQSNKRREVFFIFFTFFDTKQLKNYLIFLFFFFHFLFFYFLLLTKRSITICNFGVIALTIKVNNDN